MKHSNYWGFIYSFPMTTQKYAVYYTLFLVSRKHAQKLLDMLQQVECCLLFIHGLYNNPDETKMDQIRMKLDIDACNRNDCLNAMRL